MTHWESSAKPYHKIVGEKGHYYHQKVILPNVVKMLNPQQGELILDLGCGNGVLERTLPSFIQYTGIDGSKTLIQEAKKLSKSKSSSFLVGDVTKKLSLEKTFHKACFILSLQNMANGHLAVEQASTHLKSKGTLLLVLNHPAFRIPRQSDWGYDEKKKIVYRRIDRYQTPLAIPISMEPGNLNKSTTTTSFHYPISTYFKWLSDNGFSTTLLEEWCSDKKSEGSRAKAEDRARSEFPLFLCILAQKLSK
jgi:SAM-dependent methyltransferase